MSVTELVKPILTFRDRMRDRWCPPWLATGNNEKFMYAAAVQADTFADALIAAVALRFPGAYGYDSLPQIGKERRIARGPFESDATYAERLTRWLDDHRRRGGPYAMLAQLHAYFAPNNFPINLLYRSGRHFAMDATGAITRTISTVFAPNTNPAQWARWWLFFDLPADALADIDSTDLANLGHIPREWNAAHAQGRVFALEPGAELWGWPLGRKWNRHVKWNNPNRLIKIVID